MSRPTGMLCRKFSFLIALTAMLAQTAAKVIVAPQDIKAKVGDTVYFNCSTNEISHEIFWYRWNLSVIIYNGHGILRPFNGSFYNETNVSEGFNNLVIRSVKPSDAGKYICADDDGSGMKMSAQLVVLESDPVCKCDTQPNVGVKLTCSVDYLGNIPPGMQWKNVEKNLSMKDNVTFNDDGKTYTLTLKDGISLTKSSYICRTTRSAKNQCTCNFEMSPSLPPLPRELTDVPPYIASLIRNNRNAFTAVLTSIFFVVPVLVIVICKTSRRYIIAKIREGKCWQLSTIKGKESGAEVDPKEIHAEHGPQES